MTFDLSRLMEISARGAFAMALASGLLLFFPKTWLPFDITEFRSQCGIWLFVIFTLFISIVVSYGIKRFFNFIKKRYRLRSDCKAIISCLSDEEKAFLKQKYDKNESEIFINLSNPMHKHLQTLKIISLGRGLSEMCIDGTLPGFIQPWVFHFIRKRPKLFETKP